MPISRVDLLLKKTHDGFCSPPASADKKKEIGNSPLIMEYMKRPYSIPHSDILHRGVRHIYIMESMM